MSSDSTPASDNSDDEVDSAVENVVEAAEGQKTFTPHTSPDENSAENSADTEVDFQEIASSQEQAADDMPIKIGSQRSENQPSQTRVKPKPAPMAPVKLTSKKDPETPTQKPKSHYPPPNIRDRLSPELEKEYLAAVESGDLDDMLQGEGSEKTELDTESRRKGLVISVHRDNVFFDLNSRNQGVASLKQFQTPPEPGSTFEVMINRFNAEDGLYELTLPGAAVNVGDWSNLSEGITVDAQITGHNKGGLECKVSSIRGFIPMSQIALYRVEDLDPFVGQKLTCVVTEVNPEKRNLVLSRRAQLEREQAEARKKMLDELAVGQTREGVVCKLQDYGAFVDMGGVDGLLHVSQLSWDRINHPSEVLQVGQTIQVKIEKIDDVTGKISLSYRDLSENPWTNAQNKYPTRSTVPGTVSKIMDFGAFVRLEAGVEGLIHISELAHRRVARVSEVLSDGQQVEVMVLSVDEDAQRISLSLKALEAQPEKAQKPEQEEEPEDAAPPPKKRTMPLKGGLGKSTGGEQFGLKW